MGTSSKKLKRILVVDDEPQNIAVVHGILKPRYTIVAATDGKRAVALAKALPAPDLIMLDINMPGMDGYETLRCLKADPETSGIPVVFMTARGEVDDKMRGYQDGGADYVTKPLDPSFVTSVVDRLLQPRG
jgi:putative two-component system response regulator